MAHGHCPQFQFHPIDNPPSSRKLPSPSPLPTRSTRKHEVWSGEAGCNNRGAWPRNRTMTEFWEKKFGRRRVEEARNGRSGSQRDPPGRVKREARSLGSGLSPLDATKLWTVSLGPRLGHHKDVRVRVCRSGCGASADEISILGRGQRL